MGSANSKVKLKDYLGAIEDADYALNISSKLVPALNAKGLALSEIGELEKAIKEFNLIVEIEPSFYKVFYNRGLIKKKLGDLKGACEDWKKAAELGDEEAAKLVEEHCK